MAHQDYFTHFEQSRTLFRTKWGYHQLGFLGRNPLTLKQFSI